MSIMESLTEPAELLTTPFVSSFIGAARPGDLMDGDPRRRAAAWAQWAIANLKLTQGPKGRTYAALFLPGKFYDPKNKNPGLVPHLEVSEYVLTRPDPEFPARLAQAGNALQFPWWTLPEVTAVRRAMFIRPQGPISKVDQALNLRHLSLAAAVKSASAVLEPSWDALQAHILSGDEDFTESACGPFTPQEVAALFPPAMEMGISISFEPKLLESNGRWASRRVGVWQLHSSTTDSAFAVLTPRLTVNSLFKDPLFSPSKDSAASLLIRSLLLRRIASNHLGEKITGTAMPSALGPVPGGPYLRAVVAKKDAKTPQASSDAVLNFLRAYPQAEDAWAALVRWAGQDSVLTVSFDKFKHAHDNAQRYIRRHELPARSDMDVILPLAWEKTTTPRVVRVTFARAR